MKSQIIRTIVLTLIFVSFISCDNDKEKPTVKIIKKEYIPSKDSNNVFYKMRLAEFEGGMMIRNYMMRIDSFYKIGQLKNFEDIDYNLNYKNKSLDSTIAYYTNKYGRPIYFNKFQDEYFHMEKEIDLAYNYSSKYILQIVILFSDYYNYRNYNKIKTNKIRNFSFFPYLASWEPYHLIPRHLEPGSNHHWNQLNKLDYKRSIAMDSAYRLIQSTKKK